MIELERAKERNNVLFFLSRKIELLHEVKEFHRIFERQQPAIVKVRRRLFDTAQWESFNWPLRGYLHATFHSRFIKAIYFQVVHQPICVVRRRVTECAI